MSGAEAARRPWHRGLDRDAVATAALRILDEDGEPALTMRHLAAVLGVEAASLYAHVESKDDLVDAVLDRVLDEVVLPAPTNDPRADLVASLGTYRRTLLAHPAAVPLFTERATRSASQVRLIERSLGLLAAAGLSTRAAVDTHVTLLAYTLGFVVQEVGRSTATPRPVAEASPVLRRALATLAERGVDERFDVGLGLILDGAGVRRRRKPR
jgi:AcrR family transcriptional regulator